LLVPQNESDGLPFPNIETEFSITEAVGADLIDKPFPRSTLAEETKSGSESAKRKDATKETAATTTAENLSHKDSIDSMIFIALILHWTIFGSGTDLPSLLFLFEFLVGRPLQKWPKAPSFLNRIGMKFGMIVLQVNYASIDGFRFLI